MEAGNLTGSTSNGEHSAANSIPEKQDDAVALPASDGPEYVTGLRLFLVMFTIFTSTLLAALELGIVSTAIPGITDEFHKLDDVGWYGSATFLVAGCAAPIWGKLYKYLNVKYTYLVSVALYLVGSLVGATAPNSVAVIIGQALPLTPSPVALLTLLLRL